MPMFGFLILWGLICHHGTAFAATNPSDVGGNMTSIQMDIVFPTPNSTYKPVYPFPIVFGFPNASNALPYNQTLTWSLVARNKSSATGVFVQQAQMENPLNMNSTVRLGTYYLVIEAVANDLPHASASNGIMDVDSLANLTTNEGLLELTYKFTIDTCTSNTVENSEISGVTTFFLDANTGEMPSFGGDDGGACSVPLGAVAISDATTTSSGLAGESSCAEMAPQSPSIVECATRVGSDIGQVVAQAMLNASDCIGKKVSWPNASLTAHCSAAAITSSISSTLSAVIYGMVSLAVVYFSSA